jgi:eukaryotic-like serine/threonine-protein kinase
VDTQALDYPGDLPRDDDDEGVESVGDDVTEVVTHDDRIGDLRDATETGRMRRECSRADTARAYPVGSVLGSYRLLQQIGAGGMGRVFVAEHVRLGRRVALKVLRSEFSGNLEAVQRFFSEARAVNCISHENIIEVSDFVESQRGPSFYIMELLHGADLRSVQEREGILPLERILRIATQICSGLGAAHAAGIVHRDLKPDNIFLIERGGQRDFVKLLDFGVAKLNETVDEAETFQSTVGMVVGTPDYMAPEQALGHPVNHLADVYATGVILYEMVAGRRPFVATNAREVMVQHLTVTPCRPSMLNPAGAIPEKLEELILACLAKEPAGRPQSIGEVERRLREIADELPARELRSGARRGLRRKPVQLATAAALLAAVAAVGIWLGGGTLFASTPSIASAGELLRARIGGKRNLPAPIARSPAPFTIESATAPPAVPMPPLVRHAAPVPPAPKPAPPVRAATNPAMPPEKAVRDPSPARRSVTQPPPFIERRHGTIDRDMVLDPFE